MSSIDYTGLENFAAEHVVARFYEIRTKKLARMQLHRDILHRKNPYLFRAKNISTAETFVESVLNAFLSSQEETIFGNLMESLAIYICEQIYGGKKAEAGLMKSVDLEFIRDDNYYIVGIKSGIYWGNKDQVDRMKMNFKAAKQILRNQGIRIPIIAVNGCMYGKDRNPLKTNIDPDLSYYKYCGQEFWELVSGDSELYVRLIEPLGQEAKKRDINFQEVYTSKINEMTKDFSKDFLTPAPNYQIDWEKLVKYISEKEQSNQPSLPI